MWILPALAAVLTAPWWGIELASWLIPYPAELERRPAAAAPVLDRAGEPLWERTAADGCWRLPPGPVDARLAAAVEAAEDRRFRDHRGIDWAAVAAAAWRDLANARIVRGASTLTMQVQRLRDPRPRTPWTKLVEAVRARQLERRHGKDELLAEWLERAPFGANAVGAEAGARRWFDLPPARLGWAQLALLAALPQNPARLRPDRHPERARARRDRILLALHGLGRIDRATCDAALAEPLGAAWHPLPQERDPLLLAPLAAALAGPLPAATTIDRAAQRTCAAALAARLDALPGADAGAVLAVDPRDGAVLACAQRGPQPWQDLTRARRSPGSALKPLLYAAAFAAGAAEPGTLLDDRPGGWAGWEPANADRGHRGDLTAAEALAESRNLPAIRLAGRLGPARLGALLEDAGLAGAAARADDAGLALAVGALECSARELAALWCALAADGRRRPLAWRADERAPPGAALLPAAACRQALAALADPARTALVGPAAARTAPAWKTGTSNGRRDAWCVAASPRLVVVAWLGTARGGGDDALAGIDAAAPLALGLAAALDPQPAGWDGAVPPAPHVPAAIPALPPALAITTPADGALVELDPGRPATTQRLRLDCRGGAGARRWWFCDGVPLGEGRACWWDPAPGRHRLAVADEAGRSATVQMTVR